MDRRYPFVSIEDPFDQDDWEPYSKFQETVGDSQQIVGDDLFVFRIGTFLLEGPMSGDSNCTLGEECVMRLVGSENGFSDANSLYFLDRNLGMTCGETVVNNDLFDGIANPNFGPSDTTYRTALAHAVTL